MKNKKNSYSVYLSCGDFTVSTTVKATSLEEAITKGKDINTWNLFAKDITWIDGRLEVTGVYKD